MKKFILFILFISLLILSEYYFFVEVFSEKRVAVLLPSLVLMILSLFGIFRFAKRNILKTSQSG